MVNKDFLNQKAKLLLVEPSWEAASKLSDMLHVMPKFVEVLPLADKV